MISDKLNPDLKMNLERNDTLYLEEILESVITDLSFRKHTFSKKEISQLRTDSERDFAEL